MDATAFVVDFAGSEGTVILSSRSRDQFEAYLSQVRGDPDRVGNAPSAFSSLACENHIVFAQTNLTISNTPNFGLASTGAHLRVAFPGHVEGSVASTSQPTTPRPQAAIQARACGAVVQAARGYVQVDIHLCVPLGPGRIGQSAGFPPGVL